MGLEILTQTRRRTRWQTKRLSLKIQQFSADKLSTAEVTTPMKGTCLVRQTPAGVKSPFGEMLNVFMGRKIRAASAMAVFTQSTPLQTLYSNHRPRRKIWQKVFWQFPCLLFSCRAAIAYKQAKEGCFFGLSSLAGTASTPGRLSCACSPSGDPQLIHSQHPTEQEGSQRSEQSSFKGLPPSCSSHQTESFWLITLSPKQTLTTEAAPKNLTATD